MRAPAILAVICALALAGCTGSSSSPPTSKSAVHFAGYPSATPSGKNILWYAQVTNSGDAAGPFTIAISVLEYGTKDAGSDQKTITTIAKGQSVQLNLATKFYGFGDYDYTLELRRADGTVAEKIVSLYEYCGSC